MSTCIARQPIYDRDLEVHAYELLFRDGARNRFPDIDPHDATSRIVLEGGLTLGLAELTEGKPAFLNCSRESLVSGIAKVLPPELTVVEILESIEPDAEVIAACRELRDLGYRIALDDFVYSPRFAPLLALADVVKLEMTTTSPEERRVLLDRYSVRFVAEKIETEEELQTALSEGFHYFQGYRFGRPEMLSRPPRSASHLFWLVGAHLCRSNPDRRYLVRLIEAEPALARHLRAHVHGLGRDTTGSVSAIVDLLDDAEAARWGRCLLTEGVDADREERSDPRAA